MTARVRTPWRRYLLAASTLATLACATTPATVPVGEITASSAILQVTNSDFDDVSVFLVRSGTLIRLGTVAGLSRGVFQLSGAQLGDGGELRLVASTRSNTSAHRSGTFMASAGQRISWVIDSRLPSEVVIVR